MSNSMLTKKLLPLRKALKNVRNNLQLKSFSSKILKIIKTTRKRFVIFYQSISPLIHTKFRSLADRPPHHSQRHHHLRQNVNVSAVYIDELFQDKTLLAERLEAKENMVLVPSSSTDSAKKQSHDDQVMIETAHNVRINLGKHHAGVESSPNHEKGLSVGKGKAGSDETRDKWKIPLLPQFRGIDERAEEFIANFRQDMRLQRERSILDFEEMLKRSV